MLLLYFLIFLPDLSQSANLVEKRLIKSDNGKTFTCFYTINYNGRGVVNKKKTSVTCQPNENGGETVQVFDLQDLGKVSLRHTVKKGKDAVLESSPYTAPEPVVTSINCSCMVPFPTEMMSSRKEMMSSRKEMMSSRKENQNRQSLGTGALLESLPDLVTNPFVQRMVRQVLQQLVDQFLASGAPYEIIGQVSSRVGLPNPGLDGLHQRKKPLNADIR